MGTERLVWGQKVVQQGRAAAPGWWERMAQGVTQTGAETLRKPVGPHRILIRPETGFELCGLELSTIQVDPGRSNMLHRHNCWEVFYVLEGRGTIWVEGEEFDVERGDGISIPPNSKHQTFNHHDEPLVLLCAASHPLVPNVDEVAIARKYGYLAVMYESREAAAREDNTYSAGGNPAVETVNGETRVWGQRVVIKGREALPGWWERMSAGDAAALARRGLRPVGQPFGSHRILIRPETGFEKCGLELSLVRIDPGRETPVHRHNCWEVFYVLDGRGVIRVEDLDFPVESADAVNIPPNSRHRWVNPSDAPLSLVCCASPPLVPNTDEVEMAMRYGYLTVIDETEQDTVPGGNPISAR